MARERGYSGSVVQLRRAVARLRPNLREPFLRLEVFPGEQAQVDWRTSATSGWAAPGASISGAVHPGLPVADGSPGSKTPMIRVRPLA